MNTSFIVGIITTALNSNNNDQRSHAQNQIMQCQSSNPTQFFMICAQIVSNHTVQHKIRQSAGTVTSRLLNMINNNNGNYFWDEVFPEQKKAFKNKILSLLVVKQKQIMKSAASIIAVIASIELPRGQWEEVIDSLAQHCTSQNQSIKQASITTLGQICQKIKLAGKTINKRISEQILGSIIISARQMSEYNAQTSLKALQDSLSFLSQMMSDARYRDTVFNVFITQFQKGGRLVQNTYHALFEFVKVSSRYLNNYQKQLVDLAEVHLQQRDQTTILNLQLWQVIGTEYSQLVARQQQRIGNFANNQLNFLQSVSDRLLPLIMKCLLILNKNQQQQQDMRMSAARALQAFTKVCDRKVVDLIIDSVARIINSSDPNHQQATVILFSTICQNPDRNLSLEMFSNGFQHLFMLLNVQNKIVIKNTLIGFIRISQSLPDAFLIRPDIKNIIEAIFGYVQVDNHDIRQIAVQILSNISEGLKQYPTPVSDDPDILLRKIVKFYTENILKIHDQQKHINEKLTSIIMNIVMNTSKTEIIVQLIQYMIEKYYFIVSQNVPDLEYLIQQILSVLHTAILAHKNAIPSNDLLGRLCQLLNEHLKRFNVEQEGLSLIGAIATTFGKGFQYRSNSYWNNILQGLNSVNQVSTFKAALSCIGDLARMSQSAFYNQAQMIMKKLLDLIKQNLDRELKVHIINCMGDLILPMHNFSDAYLEDIISICDICFQAVYQLTANDKDLDYVQELKQSLIDMYSCCVFALNSGKPNAKLFNHFANLATFVVRTCDPNVHPTVDYLKSCLFLIFDSAAFYWNIEGYHQKIKQITQSNQIMRLVCEAQKFGDRPEIKELLVFIHTRKLY